MGNLSVEQISELWARSSDSDVFRAATENFEGYSPEARSIIIEEATKRKLIQIGSSGKPIVTEDGRVLHREIAERKPDMKRLVIRLLWVAAVFTILNVVLVGGQKLWHHGAQVKLATLKAQLDAKDREIKQREAELKTLSANSEQSTATITGLKARIQMIEGQYPSGIPQSIYHSYSELIDQCNSSVANHNLNIARYNSLYEDYTQRIEQYNTLVKEANAISKQVSGTWYVIPVPRYAHERPATKAR
jgi:hypothetical protein